MAVVAVLVCVALLFGFGHGRPQTGTKMSGTKMSGRKMSGTKMSNATGAPCSSWNNCLQISIWSYCVNNQCECFQGFYFDSATKDKCVKYERTLSVHFKAVKTGSPHLLKGTGVTMSLYHDDTYKNPVRGSLVKAEVFDQLYMKMVTSGNDKVKVNPYSCDVHLEDDKHVSYRVNMAGCTASESPLTTQKNYTYQFQLFELPREASDLYITCYLAVCQMGDYSDKCIGSKLWNCWN